MADVVHELWGNASVAKLAYSIVLLALIWLLGRELVRVWWDPQLYIGNFKYFRNGQPDAGRAESFGANLLAQHSILRGELDQERRNRSKTEKGPVEILRIWPTAEGTISLPPQVKQIELKINGFDVGGLLTSLRGWISPPNEVAVTVQARAFAGTQDEVQRVDTDVTWPRAPNFGDSKSSSLQHFNTWASNGDEEAAALLAASLIWADAAKHNPDLRSVGRENFSDWAFAWLQARIVAYERGTPGNLSDQQKERLEAAGARIASLLKNKTVYPEIWRLAADLVTLDPQSIPDGDAVSYRREYFKALGIEDPVPLEGQAEGIAGVAPGSLIFGADRNLAVRLTAVVTDQDGKKLLLFPDLIANKDERATDVYGSLLSAAPIATVVRRISSEGLPPIALAEIASGAQVGRGVFTAIGKEPKVGETVTIVPANKPAKVDQVDVTFAPLGNGFVEVSPKITKAGDAGAPIIDGGGRLVAMGYAARDKTSLLVPLADLLQRERLTLVSAP
jgi:hypothetical protein